MSNITKHDSKQEGEHDNGEHSWVDLSVPRYSVGVDDFLEGCGEVVGSEVSGRVCMFGSLLFCDLASDDVWFSSHELLQ